MFNTDCVNWVKNILIERHGLEILNIKIRHKLSVDNLGPNGWGSYTAIL